MLINALLVRSIPVTQTPITPPFIAIFVADPLAVIPVFAAGPLSEDVPKIVILLHSTYVLLIFNAVPLFTKKHVVNPYDVDKLPTQSTPRRKLITCILFNIVKLPEVSVIPVAKGAED
jgi:hypothetical protein